MKLFTAALIGATILGTAAASAQSIELNVGGDRGYRTDRHYHHHHDGDWRDSRAYYRGHHHHHDGETVIIKKKKRVYREPRANVVIERY